MPEEKIDKRKVIQSLTHLKKTLQRTGREEWAEEIRQIIERIGV